jgi:hypothetical protein
VPLEVREARTDAEVAAAGRVTVAANAEFAPADPDGPFAPSTEWMPVARAMYERAGFRREPEGDEELPGVTIIAYAAELEPAGDARA